MPNRKELFREILLMTVGTVIMVIGIYFFKYPNNFSTGGVSGMTVILSHYIPGLSRGNINLFINGFLLVVGYFVFGRSFGFKTAYVSLLQSGLLWVLEHVMPLSQPLTSQPMLEIIFAVSLPAIGSAILFNIDASSGGTDIVAMVLRKYTSINIGNALLCSDIIITLMALVAFGPETGLFSILGLVMKSLLVDMVMENINTHKCFHIITRHPDAIENYIMNDLHRGATRLKGQGIYTNEDCEIILTVVGRRQAVQLRRYAKSIDPSCFVLINNTGEIIGKGFRGVN